MKLYYSPLSVYSAKPRIAMFEKAIAHETRLVNWTPGTGWIKPEELPRLNPKAQIPVLVDGEAVIPDSTIILEYLEERFPKPALFPSGAAERARCRVLEDLGDTLLAPNLGVLVREVLLKPDASTRDRDGGRADEGRARAPVSAARSRAGQARVPVRRIQRRRHLVLLADQHRVVDGGRTVARVQQPGELALANEKRPSVARYLAEFSEATAPLRAATPAASAHA